MHAYIVIILASWILFLTVWGVGALMMKPDAQSRGSRSFFWRAVIIFLIIYVGSKSAGIHFGDKLLFQSSPDAGWIGAALTVIGIGIAVWARFHLGRNWSSHPTFKAEHELVTDGPYQYVRHPIYTGVLLALLGTVFIGYLYTIVIFLGVSAMFLARIPTEERTMLRLFPEQYPAYRSRTKKLVPFIW